MSTSWMAQQLMQHPAKRSCANAGRQFESGSDAYVLLGKIREDSTTSKVMQFLADHATNWYRLGAIAKATHANPKTVSWALDRLKHMGLLETCGIGDPKQCPRFLRYRWKSV